MNNMFAIIEIGSNNTKTHIYKDEKDMSLEVIGENIARDLYERLGFKTHYRKMVLKINDDIYEN